MFTIEWPMNVLTKSTGKRRRLISAPDAGVKRESIQPSGDGFVVKPDGVLLPAGRRYFIETKEQGHFHYFARNIDGEYSMYGKRETVCGNYRDIWPLVEKGLKDKLPGIPPETAFAIELIWPGHQDSKVPTAIKECPEQLEIRALAVAIYKGVLIAGTDMGYTRGRRILKHCFESHQIVELHGAIDIEYGDAERNAKVLSYWLERAKLEEIEGYVLKSAHYSGWYKLKGIRECDAFVIGFKISESDTYYGQVTSLELGMWDEDAQKTIPVGRASGFPDELKNQLTASYKEHGTEVTNPFMFKACRVTYQEIGTRGGIKHGFFDGWREDKSSEDCLLEQLQ